MEVNEKFIMDNHHCIDHQMGKVAVYEAVDLLSLKSLFENNNHQMFIIHQQMQSKHLHQKFDIDFYINQLPEIEIAEQVSSNVNV